MKKFKGLFAVFVCLLFLSSCAGNGYTSTDLMYIMQSSLEELPDSSLYFSGSPETESTYISESELSELYGADITKLCKSYALMLSKSTHIYEIHIFRALSDKDAQNIEQLLYTRLERLQKKDIYIYDDEHYESVVSRGQVYRKGLYVFLLVTDDNSRLLKVIKKSV